MLLRSLVILGVALVSLSAPPAWTARQPPYDPCPAVATIKSSGHAEAVIGGAYAAIKRVFPHINYGQGRTTPVTRRTTLISEVVSLSRTSRDALAFRRLASRRCGPATARVSWAVVAQFPNAPMATTGQVAFFLAYTVQGWRLYGSVFDRH